MESDARLISGLSVEPCNLPPMDQMPKEYAKVPSTAERPRPGRIVSPQRKDLSHRLLQWAFGWLDKTAVRDNYDLW
jgi:hypothetical protein